ncbi:craniofacial development protein 2-like [Schistocerca piceifrons]|uniref:craniofacial development protein 2-like n=1 Tax=Schistocerca piceifrons TaxID=274613 RepID=UPI001F5F324F|nr:craniofacial development protein 2-like [Schistocerca piceifrons]
MTGRFKSKVRNVTLIQYYDPTETSEIEKEEEFYYLLRETVRKVSKKDILIVMGDIIAKVWDNNEGLEQIMGVQGLGEMNDNGERFSDFCAIHDLVIGGTLFPYRRCYKITWVSPDIITENQIDHIAVSRKFRRSLKDVWNRRGEDASSDHHLVTASFQLKIVVSKKKFEPRNGRFDVGKLKDPQIAEGFQLELRNRFQALELEMTEDKDMEEIWTEVKNSFVHVSERQPGFKNHLRRDWMSEHTWRKITHRKEAKGRVNQNSTRRQTAQAHSDYQQIRK